MPSACAVIERLLARWTIALTMLTVSRSSGMSRMNERSIFRMSTGSCFSLDRDE
jgi:AraC-like DNA-binding protein